MTCAREDALRIVPNDEFKAGAEAQGFPCPDVIVDGEVVDVDAPHRLVTTWRLLMDPTTAAEPMTTITYEIEEFDGYCRLTVEHDVTGAPATASMVRGDGESQGAGGGHDWILSDLKSLLETGSDPRRLSRRSPFDVVRRCRCPARAPVHRHRNGAIRTGRRPSGGRCSAPSRP